MTLRGRVTGVATVALVAVAAAVAYACSSTSPHPSDSGAGAQCVVPKPGEFPAPDVTCATSCAGITTGCPIDEAKCGTKSTCLPMASNSGKTTLDFRIRRLNVSTPPALAQGFIQKGIVDQGISLKAKTCGELGDGAFNWLIRVDKTASTVTTGGAPPSSDPFGVGYCFAHTSSGTVPVAPVSGKITFSGSTFSSEVTPKLAIPIFVHGDSTQLIVLPLSMASFSKVTISNDTNCIGSFNYGALDTACADSREDCEKWNPSGALGGFITLEEADQVKIPDLGGKTLCVMLTASTGAGADGLHCRRDANGKIDFAGDYCSTSSSPGGCADSYWLAATFAASAVKIHDGAGEALCAGAASTDAGSD